MLKGEEQAVYDEAITFGREQAKHDTLPVEYWVAWRAARQVAGRMLTLARQAAPEHYEAFYQLAITIAPD